MARISGKPLAVSGDVTVDSPTFHIDSDNDLVGIGTTSPSTALHVKSETGDTAIKIQAGSESDDDGAAQVTFSDYQRTASIGLMSTDIVIAKDSSIDPLSDDRRVTIDVDNGNVGVGHKFGQHRRPEGSSSASVLTVENTTTSGSAQGGNLRLGSNDGAVMGSGHRLGVIEFAGSEAASPGPAGSAMAVGARIEAVTDDTWSTTENGASLDFYTTDGDAAQTKQMTILATGDVGIGPTAPVKNLHVSKASGEATIRLQSAGYYADIIQSGANLFIQNAAGGGNTIFYDDAAERMRIDTDGNVGIGTNDPSTKLTVEGTVTLKEQANAETDVAAYGQVWVKSGTPNTLYFTDDAGTDFQLGAGSAPTTLVLNVETSTDADITVDSANYYVLMDTSGSSTTTRTVTLPENPTAGTTFVIKDVGGAAGDANIAVTSADNIDGTTTQTINTNYASITVVSNGANYFIV